MEFEDPPSPAAGQRSSRISREIVRFHASVYGRGPTRAKTFLHDEYALCVLEDVFTRAEQTLVAADNADQVLATRRAFQDAVGDELTSIVEEATGRQVRAVIGQVHIETNLAVELFLFEPRGETEPAIGFTTEDGHE